MMIVKYAKQMLQVGGKGGGGGMQSLVISFCPAKQKLKLDTLKKRSDKTG